MTKATGAERLEQVLSAYGANPENWPSEERPALEEIAATDDPRVRTWTHEAMESDMVLSLAQEIEVPEGAMDRVLGKARQQPRGEVIDFAAARANRPKPQSRPFDFRQAVPVGIAMAASLFVGVMVGLNDQAASYLPDTGLLVSSLEGQGASEDDLISFEPFTITEGGLL